MRQILVIPLLCYLFQLFEYCLFSLFGRWGDPHLMLLLVIFFNLYSGIRFSLWAALCGGIRPVCPATCGASGYRAVTRTGNHCPRR